MNHLIPELNVPVTPDVCQRLGPMEGRQFIAVGTAAMLDPESYEHRQAVVHHAGQCPWQTHGVLAVTLESDSVIARTSKGRLQQHYCEKCLACGGRLKVFHGKPYFHHVDYDTRECLAVMRKGLPSAPPSSAREEQGYGM